jgi:hypothetical protein
MILHPLSFREVRSNQVEEIYGGDHFINMSPKDLQQVVRE